MIRYVVPLVFVCLCAAPAAAQALSSHGWRITEIAGLELDAQARARTSLRFDAAQRRMAGTIGCNRMMGSYEAVASALTFGPLAATRMACPGVLDARERAFAKALGDTRRWRIAGRVLILSGEGGAVLMRLEPEPHPGSKP